MLLKMKLGELRNCSVSLGKILGVENFKLAYRVMKLTKKVQSELTEFEKIRIEMLKKYGTLKGDIYTLKPDNVKTFNKQLQEILDEEITLDIDLIPLSLLRDADVKLSSLDLVNLEKFIKDDLNIKEPTQKSERKNK
jgi:hypothetical protein